MRLTATCHAVGRAIIAQAVMALFFCHEASVASL